MSVFRRLFKRPAKDHGGSSKDGLRVEKLGSTKLAASRPPVERVLVLQEGEDPWSWEGDSALILTGRGAFIARRGAFYAYAVPAAPEDFRAVFGDTGREFAPKRTCDGGVFKLAVRIPQCLLHEAWSFLHAAWRRYGTEDILLLHFLHEAQRYTLVHPQLRYASPQDVGYACPPTPPGAVLFGSIHSHPYLAFHSLVDDADVSGIPGLHVVLGDLDLPVASIVCVLSGAAGTVRVSSEDVFDPPVGDRFQFPSLCSFPAEWLARSAKLPDDPLKLKQEKGKEMSDGPGA